MVSAAVAKAANDNILPATLPADFTAVFIGATSGIGRSALEQLVTASRHQQLHIYVVARDATAAAQQIAGLRQINPSAVIELIEKDVSLVKSVDEVAEIVKKRESKVDLLFLSMGFIPFAGRKGNTTIKPSHKTSFTNAASDTTEGLEPSMTTRYYSRIRAIQLLLPLLNASPNPHVTNILAGGQEAPLIEDDLDLARPGNFSFIQASKHSATMLTLMLEKFASENPVVSFVHAFPGPVATPTLTRGSSGIVAILMRWIISPFVNTFIAESVINSGAKALFYATNARYTVSSREALAAAMPEGVGKARQSKGGVFLVHQNGEPAGDERLLDDLRKASEAVWEHTTDVFERVTR